MNAVVTVKSIKVSWEEALPRLAKELKKSEDRALLGQSITLKWRGKPVFIRHRTAAEIDEALRDDALDMRDPQNDADRVQKPEYLVVLGVCTHLGCVPLGQKVGEVRGEYDGWFCPCHGSHYDSSGRIRKGPAPTNLEVPPYSFLSDDVVKIG